MSMKYNFNQDDKKVNQPLDVKEQVSFEYNRVYVYRVLKEHIVLLKFKPGEKISEVQMQGMFNVSRSPIREAIVRLVDEALIEVRPQRGTYISLLDSTLIEESIFMRSAIDKEIMRMACSKDYDTSSLEAQLKNVLEKQEKIAEQELNDESVIKFLNLNYEFHRTIYKFFNKAKIWDNIHTFGTHYQRFHFLESYSKTNIEFALNQHPVLIEAISNKNFDMACSMEENLLSNYRVKLRILYKKYPNYFKYKID